MRRGMSSQAALGRRGGVVRVAGALGDVVHGLVFEFADGSRSGAVT